MGVLVVIWRAPRYPQWYFTSGCYSVLITGANLAGDWLVLCKINFDLHREAPHPDSFCCFLFFSCARTRCCVALFFLACSQVQSRSARGRPKRRFSLDKAKPVVGVAFGDQPGQIQLTLSQAKPPQHLVYIVLYTFCAEGQGPIAGAK